MGATVSIRVQGWVPLYQGTGMGATVSIRVHGLCHCEYQHTWIVPL